MKKHPILLLLLLSSGCGGRIEPTALGSDASPDTGSPDSGDGPRLDAAVSDFGIGMSEAMTVDATPSPPPPKGDGPYITSLDACGSAPGVDKIIIHVSEPVQPVADINKTLHVMPGGTTCSETIDDRSPTGEYAFGAKCGTIDTTKPIVVVIDVGIMTAAGKSMTTGTYTFRPTGKPGRLCGSDFRL